MLCVVRLLDFRFPQIRAPGREQNNSLLFYPLHFEGEENSKNVVYLNSPPRRVRFLALEYLMGPEGGKAKRFFMLSFRTTCDADDQQDLQGLLGIKGLRRKRSWKKNLCSVGFSNFQTIVNDIRQFINQPGSNIIILTVVGSSIPDFLRNHQSGDQGDGRSRSRPGYA